MTVDDPPGSGSVPGARPPSLVGQVLDGRYRLIRKLEDGDSGEIYAAEHVHFEKRCAITLLRQDWLSNLEAVTRFRQAAQAAAAIGHRNIVAIEDFGQLADGRIYMCMEYLNGATLADMITQPIAVDRLLDILIQTCQGLAAAHAKGIIHRDVKPENIFVTIGPGGEFVPKLGDFSLAKIARDGRNHLTRPGTIFGTPFYMAPEQALGNPVDARADIYAVGVIMYECFSGTLPFHDDSYVAILTRHITVEPEPVAQRAARSGRQLQPELAEVITRCLQKNPAHRFQTMDELVNALSPILRGIAQPADPQPAARQFHFDVALSFAGEDRPLVDRVAHALRAKGISVFYDDFEKPRLWGKDLYQHFHEIYSRQARYCLMFISHSYVRKSWTNHERRSAQERALAEKGNEYILPVRLDDAEVPGVMQQIGYIDMAIETVDSLVSLVGAKLAGI